MIEGRWVAAIQRSGFDDRRFKWEGQTRPSSRAGLMGLAFTCPSGARVVHTRCHLQVGGKIERAGRESRQRCHGLGT
jgi:hypothetical protein